MGNNQCQQCEPERGNLNFTAYSPYQSISEIEEKYRAYAESNMLGFYSVRMQKNIERLYTLGQMHICDLIIRLTCQQRTEKRDRILDDIERIDLEQLDHLSLIGILPKSVHNKYSAASSNYYDEETTEQLSLNNQPILQKPQETLNQQYGLRILNKYALKGKLGKFVEAFKSNHFFVVATVGCFESQDVLVPLNLPTKKSPLRLFLQKIEGASIKHRTSILTVFIVTPDKEPLFDKEVAAYEQQLKEDYSDTDEFDPPFLNIQKIIYRPIYPCVDLDRKIQVNSSGDGILFNEEDGDLIGFMMQDPILLGLFQKYEFVQMANVSNILEGVADREALGYLAQHVEIDIVAPVLMEDAKAKGETLKLNKYFVERATFNSKTSTQKSYQLIQSYYFRAMLLTNKGSHFHKIIATRIKSNHLPKSPDVIYFSRNFENILYSPITVLLVVTKKNFTSPIHQEINYSNYCKSVLGISDTKDEQIVQICPQILFGVKSQLLQIIQKLRNLSSVGFPLVLNRQRMQIRVNNK